MDLIKLVDFNSIEWVKKGVYARINIRALNWIEGDLWLHFNPMKDGERVRVISDPYDLSGITLVNIVSRGMRYAKAQIKPEALVRDTRW